MSPLHRRCALGLIAFVLGGHAVSLLADRELWPFSQYPMYSYLQGPTYTQHRLYGVANGRRFALDAATHFAPFDPSRLQHALRRTSRDRPRHQLAARWLFERYEATRREGRHTDPPLDEIVVAIEAFELRRDLKNLDDPDATRIVGRIRR